MKNKNVLAKWAPYLVGHPVAAILVDTKTHLVCDSNKSAQTFLGFSGKQLSTMSLSNFTKRKIVTPRKATKTLGTYLINTKNGQKKADIVTYKLNQCRDKAIVEFHVVNNDKITAIKNLPKILSGIAKEEYALSNYRQLTDTTEKIPDAVVFQFLLTKNGKQMSFPYMSAGAHKLFGVDAKEIVKNNELAFNVIHPEDLPYVMASMNQSLDNLEEYSVTHRIIVDSKTKWINTKSKPQKLTNGSVLWHGVSMDVTEMVNLHYQSVSIKDQYLSLVQCIDGIVWQANADTLEFTFVSDQSSSLLGYSPAQWLGERDFWANHIIDQDREKTLSFCSQELDRNRNHKLEYRMTASDGRIVWIYDQVWVKGKIMGGIMIDISSQKFAQHRLEESEQQLRAVLNATRDFTYVVNRDLKIIIINKAAEQSAKALIQKEIKVGDSILEYASVGNVDLFLQRVNRSFQGETIEAEFEMTTGHRKLWIAVVYNPVFDANNSVVAVSINLEDQTQRKAVERELKEKERQLRSLADNLPKGVIYQRVFNADGTQRSAYFSKGIVELLGVPVEEAIKNRDYFRTVASQADYDYVISRKKNPDRDSGIFDYEFPVTHRISGKRKWIHNISQSTFMDDGSLSWDGILLDITGRKDAEQALQNSEANLRAMLDNTDTACILFDVDFKVKSFNKLAELLTLQFSNKKIEVGVHASTIVQRDREETLTNYFKNALLGEAVSYQIQLGTSENPLHLFGRMFAVRPQDGKVVGVILALTDITLIVESRKKVDRSQQLYESLVKSQTSFLIRTDMHGCYSYVNKRFLEHFGFDEDDILGKHSFESIHPEDWGICERAVMDCIAFPGKVVKATFRKPTKTGKYFWTEWEFVAIQNDMGELTDIQCLGYDITDGFEKQAQLKKMARRLTVAAQSAKIGVWEWDLTTNYIEWDKMMFELYGLEYENGPSFERFQKCIYPEDQLMVEEMTQKTINKREPIDASFRIIRQNDKSVRHLKSFGVYDASQLTYTGVNIDVTDLIEKENQIRLANLQIEQLQLNALRSAMNPHFIFNTLNSIQHYVVQNQQENALRYLSKFSKLMRGILESSVKNQTRLADELELVRYYVELEQLRFENKFDFVLDVCASVEIELVEIPSLLMQPYIENAILHGLQNRTEGGMLKIVVEEIDNFLQIKIEDNGIGRTAALMLRKKKFPQHQSMGTTITEKRINLLSHHQTIELVVEDLYDANEPTGTRVTIKIKR